MEHKVFGTFVKSDGYIYRTDTYIQFGKFKKIIGACVLCNPGSASLSDSSAQESLEKFNGYKVIQGEVKDDNTIRQLIKILKGVYGEGLEGQFLIFNLFTLRHPHMDTALKLLKNKNIDKELLNKDYFDYKEKESSIPWTLVGWGCKKNKDLDELKTRWQGYLKDNNLTHVGKEHKDPIHFYHPLPPIYDKQLEYVDLMISKLNDLNPKKAIKST